MNANTTSEKDWTISMIEALSEDEARKIAQESMQIKEHTVYFVDFGGYFGYSTLVFMDGMHVYHANDYELHFRGLDPDREGLKARLIRYAENKLFTEAEITSPVHSYDEYKRKSEFLHNYYGMRRHHVSIFYAINPTKEQQAAFKRQTASMHYNPVCFAYFDDPAFIEHHLALHVALEKAWHECQSDFNVLKKAFISEMYNHEYCINYQADYDTLSAFGNLQFAHDGTKTELDNYFDQLNFTETQRNAYLAARKEYLKQVNETEE